MITFLGRIRSDLMRQNRFKRYLAYSLGEIFLVVIGILIALKVNNMNETRKIRITEQVFLKGLKEDMLVNKEQLLIAMDFHKKSREAALLFQGLYGGDHKNYRTDQLDSLLAEIQWAWTYDPRMGVLNSIKMSGQINIIQNSQISTYISSFDEMMKDAIEESLMLRTMIIERFVPHVSNYVSVSTRAKHIGFTKLKESHFPSDYKALFKDRSLQSLIGYIYIWREEEFTEEQGLLKNMEAFIAELETEIDEN
jgi:Family of unknown function (DUF6090)